MRYLGRRLLVYVFALWGAVTINYLLPRMRPGRAYSALDPSLANQPQIAENLRAQLGAPGDSFWGAYPGYLGQILRGDLFFGLPGLQSYIVDQIPYSLALAVASTLLAFVIGTALGAISAWRRGGLLDGFIPTLAMTMSSFPPYFVALGAVYLLALKWKLFPTQLGYAQQITPGPTVEFASSAFRHAQLPILVLVVVYLGFWVVSMRNTMINTLSDDYLLLAHAKGLRGGRVLVSYAGRNAILVPLAMFAAIFSTSLDGIIIVEKVFSYPGTGLLFQNAAQAGDYWTVQSLLLIFTLSVLATNLFVDIVTVLIDPRLRGRS